MAQIASFILRKRWQHKAAFLWFRWRWGPPQSWAPDGPGGFAVGSVFTKLVNNIISVYSGCPATTDKVRGKSTYCPSVNTPLSEGCCAQHVMSWSSMACTLCMEWPASNCCRCRKLEGFRPVHRHVCENIRKSISNNINVPHLPSVCRHTQLPQPQPMSTANFFVFALSASATYHHTTIDDTHFKVKRFPWPSSVGWRPLKLSMHRAHFCIFCFRSRFSTEPTLFVCVAVFCLLPWLDLPNWKSVWHSGQGYRSGDLHVGATNAADASKDASTPFFVPLQRRAHMHRDQATWHEKLVLHNACIRPCATLKRELCVFHGCCFETSVFASSVPWCASTCLMHALAQADQCQRTREFDT